jgi:hypothetical protein
MDVAAVIIEGELTLTTNFDNAALRQASQGVKFLGGRDRFGVNPIQDGRSQLKTFCLSH